MSRQAWLQALMLAGLLLLLQAGGDETQAALRFSRQALEQGAWWRLFTAHFIHLGWAHTVLNIAGVLLCCALAPQLFNPYIWPRMACLAFGVGISLWCWTPEVTNYVGFSGVLYGLFFLGLWPEVRRGDRLAAFALAMTVGWMLWQWVIGPWTMEERWIGGRIASMAHLYGFSMGVAMSGANRVWRSITFFKGNI